jgi:hypothetical protein
MHKSYVYRICSFSLNMQFHTLTERNLEYQMCSAFVVKIDWGQKKKGEFWWSAKRHDKKAAANAPWNEIFQILDMDGCCFLNSVTAVACFPPLALCFVRGGRLDWKSAAIIWTFQPWTH